MKHFYQLVWGDLTKRERICVYPLALCKFNAEQGKNICRPILNIHQDMDRQPATFVRIKNLLYYNRLVKCHCVIYFNSHRLACIYTFCKQELILYQV